MGLGDMKELVKVKLQQNELDLGLHLPSQIALPFFRKIDKRKHKYPRIEVMADSMRIGKTTAVKVIERELRLRGIPILVGEEEWENNVYLAEAYNAKDSRGLSKAVLKSQRWFAKRKFEQLKRKTDDTFYIQDVNPEMDFIYATTNHLLSRISDKDFSEYVQFYLHLLWENISFPDLLIYLTAMDRVVLQRTRQALRDFETVRERYILTMKMINQAWLKEAKRRNYPIMVINTDEFDFSKSKNEQVHLTELVLDGLKLRGFNW